MLFATWFFLTLCLVPIKCASFRKGLLDEDVCEKKECYDAAEQIKKWMNPAFNPCEDFYEFTCGYWHSPDNSTVNKVYNSSLGLKGTIVNFYIKNFLQDEEIVKESKLFATLKQFLSLCLDEETINARGVSHAVEALRKAGGWPVLEQDWSEEKWSIENTIIAFGWRALFEVYLGLSDNYTSTLRIQVMYPDYRVSLAENLSEGLQNPHIKEYYTMGCELAEAFGADRCKAEADMKEAVEFEIAITKLMKRINAARDPFKLYPDDKITISELQDYISWVNWTYLLTNVLPESVPITKDYIIVIEDLERLKELGNLIDNYPKRTVANYVMWKIAYAMTEILPANVRNITGVKDERPFEDRIEQCVKYVTESSLVGALASYIAKKTVNHTKLAKEMTENILNELLIEISELEWLDEKTRLTAIRTLNETTMLIAFPEEAMDLTVMEDIYKKVNINTSNFLEAMVDLAMEIRKTEFEMLGPINTSEISIKDKIRLGLSFYASFIPSVNTVVVPAGFMHSLPLFSPEIPAYVNYGHLGAVIAHEIIHALDIQTAGIYTNKWLRCLDNSWLSSKNGYKAKHVMKQWVSNETEEVYNEKKQCIIDQYGSFKDTKYTGLKLNSNHTDREDLADNGGFKVALRAYRRVVANLVTPEPRLPTLQQYSPEQLFILSLANTYCEIPDKENLKRLIQWGSHSPSEFRIKGTAMNSRDFGEWFHCQKGDPMNPVVKCEVW